jgi:hypothetical protein
MWFWHPCEAGNGLCENGDYVEDAGANLEIFSFLSSNRFGEGGHVFAIEPIDFFVKCMEERIQNAGERKGIGYLLSPSVSG